MAERTNIYYWKCDREDAFHGTADYQKGQSGFLASVSAVLTKRFGDAVHDIAVSCGQGNHRTFAAVDSDLGILRRRWSELTSGK